jgi:hypothetical protein
LGQLYEWHLQHSDPPRRVVRISLLDYGPEPELDKFSGFWFERVHEPWEQCLDYTGDDYVTYIIDEAQKLFPLGPQHLFWAKVKQVLGREGGRKSRILFLAAYGFQPDDPAAPITFSVRLNLSTTLLNRAEFDEIFHKYDLWRSDIQEDLRIGPGTRDKRRPIPFPLSSTVY